MSIQGINHAANASNKASEPEQQGTPRFMVADKTTSRPEAKEKKEYSTRSTKEERQESLALPPYDQYVLFELALYFISDINELIRDNKHDQQDVKDLQSLCEKVICSKTNKFSTYQHKLKAAILLAEFYGNANNARGKKTEPEKAADIIACAIGKTEEGRDYKIEIGGKIVDLKAVFNELVATERPITLTPFEIQRDDEVFYIQALAEYHDFKTRNAKYKENPALFNNGIAEIKECLSKNVSSEKKDWAKIQAYYVLAKLLAATGEPANKEEAKKICLMLNGSDKSGSFSLGMKKGSEIVQVPMPFVDALGRGEEFFKNATIPLLFNIACGDIEGPIPQEKIKGIISESNRIIGDPNADNYSKALAKFQQAECYMQQECSDPKEKIKNAEKMVALYRDVLNSPAITDVHMKGHASVNYGTALLMLKDYETAKGVFNLILGTGPGPANNIQKVGNDPDVQAQATIGIIEAEIAIAQKEVSAAKDEKTKTEAEARLSKIKEDAIKALSGQRVLGYDNAGKSQEAIIIPYTFERAALDLADIYASSKNKEDKGKARDIYAKLLNGGVQKDAGSLVKAPIDQKNTYNLLRAKLGKAQTMLDLKENAAEAKTLLIEVLSNNNADEVMRANAALRLAEVLVIEPANAGKAEELFSAVLKGTDKLTLPGQDANPIAINATSDSYTRDRANLGLQISMLSQPEKRNAKTKAEAVEELTKLAETTSDERIAKSALIETVSVQSESSNDQAKTEATNKYSELASLSNPDLKDISERAKLEKSILELDEKDEKKVSDAIEYLTAQVTSSNLASFFKQKAALALANHFSKDKDKTEDALVRYDEIIKTTDDVFIKSSALIGRADLEAKSTDKDGKEKARTDYIEALRTITGKDGSIPGGFRLLEIQANKGLTNVTADLYPELAAELNDKDVTLDDGTVVKSRRTIQERYRDAKNLGEVTEDKYLETDILFDSLDKELNAWHHKKGKDQAASGRILKRYEDIINGDYPDQIKNRARVTLARALQTMGQPEEAKKVLAHAVSASIADKQITEIDMADVMNNYGFIALGDSDFNLAHEYFRKAAESDKDTPNSIIYQARAAFLTEKFSKDFSMAKIKDLYEEALNKAWGAPEKNGTRPSIEDMTQAAFNEDKTALNNIANTPKGRFMVLTALEAQAKILYAKGNSKQSAACFERAKELFGMWKGSGAEMMNDYLFEYQLHYDLASVYLSLPNRLYDAYNEYKQIANMPGVPNWFIKDQMRVLDPEQITVTASDNGDMNIAYRRHFERGGFGIRITEDGASADTYILLGKDKSQAVKVHFGAFNHGVIDAGIGYSKDFGRARVSAGIDYDKDAKGNEVIGINAAAEFRVSRYLTLGIDGKYEVHNELIDDTTSRKIGYGTYELGVSANYGRRIGKDTTFSANARVAYGTQRDYSVSNTETMWIDQITTPTSTQTDWHWDTPTSCFTTNSGSDDKLRQRYWINYNVYDLSGKPMSSWHLSTAVEPDTNTVKVPTPVYGRVSTETIDVPLNDLYMEGFAHMEGTSVVFNDSRNAILTNPGEQPTSQQINALDVNTLTNDSSKPRVLIHKESYTTSTSTNKYASKTTIKVSGQNRVTPEGKYPSESDPWGEKELLYTIEVSSTTNPVTGAVEKTVTMTGKDGDSKVLYKGGSMKVMKDNIKAAIEEYYKGSLYTGITKKFHGTFLPDGTEVTLSGSITAKYIPGKARIDENNNITPAKQQLDLSMGPRLDARVPAGNGYFRAGVGYIYNGTKMNVKDDNGLVDNKWVYGGWEPEAYIGYTANLSGNDIENGTYVNASVSTSGPSLGVSKGPVSVGIGTSGPQVGLNAHLKLGNTQLLGDVPVSISATGLNIAGIPVTSAVDPVTLGIGSLAKAITDSKALKAIGKEKERLEKEIADAQNSEDKETAAYLRFIYDNLFLEEGSHQANWLKDSTRIPVLNLLTALTGTRVRKNAGSIAEETRQITGHFSSLKDKGVFEILKDGKISDENREVITQYIANKTDYQGQNKGNIAKAADIQDKVVKGALTPLTMAGKALHITGNKPAEGCLLPSSFKAVSDKRKVRHQIIDELTAKGYIEAETGKVTEKSDTLADADSLGLSEELKDKQQMVYEVLKTAVKESKIGTVAAPPEPKTDEELKEALNKKIREDSMYLVYRTIAERGSTPETRKDIAKILATLPFDIRVELESFIDNLPADIRFRSDKTVKVAVESEGAKDKKVKVTPETYTRSVMQGESYSGKLEIENAAIEEFKSGKPNVETAFSALTEALSKSADTTSDIDNDKVNDAVYRSALVLFMLAADSPENADAVATKMKDLKKDQVDTLKNLKGDIADFILNRRPGSTKIFGGQKDKIRVINNSLSVKGRKFTIEEYIGLAINGKLEEEIDARIKAEELEKALKKAKAADAPKPEDASKKERTREAQKNYGILPGGRVKNIAETNERKEAPVVTNEAAPVETAAQPAVPNGIDWEAIRKNSLAKLEDAKKNDKLAEKLIESLKARALAPESDKAAILEDVLAMLMLAPKNDMAAINVSDALAALPDEMKAIIRDSKDKLIELYKDKKSGLFTREKIKVTGAWGKANRNGMSSVIDAKFELSEFIDISLNNGMIAAVQKKN